jgi:hypothetical protein
VSEDVYEPAKIAEASAAPNASARTVARQVLSAAYQSGFAAREAGTQPAEPTVALNPSAKSQQGGRQTDLAAQVRQALVKVAVNSSQATASSANANQKTLLARLPADLRLQAFAKQATVSSPQSSAAQQISNAALKGFAAFENGTAAAENSPQARGRFIEQAQATIDQGFADVRKLLGNVPTSTEQSFANIRDLADQRLNSFVGVNRLA